MAGAASAPAGALSQLVGMAGCVYEPPPADAGPSALQGVCAPGRALVAPSAVVVSPDGGSVYVAAAGEDAVAVFARDAGSGVLRQLPGARGCVAEDTDSGCAAAHPLFGVDVLAVSPDGRNLYAASENGVVVFSRQAGSGEIRQLAAPVGCLTGGGDGACTTAVGMDAPTGLAISPDGGSVYVASSGGGSVAVFSRNSATGALSQLAGAAACVAPEAADPGGVDDNATSPCTAVVGLNSPPAKSGEQTSVAVSPDGKSVYVASYEAVAVFSRSASGALSQAGAPAGCVATRDAIDEGLDCAEARGLGFGTGIVVAPDGQTVAVSSSPILTADFLVDSGVAVFRRNPATGSLGQSAGAGGCVTDLGAPLGCSHGRGLGTDPNAEYSPNAVALGADGKTLYVATVRGSGDETGTISTFALGASGTLTQLPGRFGCLGPPGGGCESVRGMTGSAAVAVSRDGRNVYAAGYSSDSIVVLAAARATARLVVRKVGAGSVTSAPSGINCGPRCSAALEVGSRLTLTAKAARGSTFAGWQGLCHGTRTSCTLTIKIAGTVTARFKKARG
jgi:DNA-binding beta-propeller fold protein YncE